MAYLNPAAGATREGKQAASVTALTNSNGTADNTIADVGTSFNQGTLNNNFRDLSDKVNAIIAALKAAGLMA
ncbi:hypothetical protein AB0F36_14220 [Streptomyces sp. NPDC029080]|uniref:hypothetical protein n=1 Tax=Streptomyces sp. NPDC029080 TaxID=3155017 RepID=UPI0034066A78